MTKTVRDTASAAEQSFHRHYAAIWGDQRWALLYRALAYPTRYAALVNRYAPDADFEQALKEAATPGASTANSNASSVPSGGLEQLEFPKIMDDSLNDKDRLLCYTRKLEATGEHEENGTEQSTAIDFPQPRPSPSQPAHLTTHWNLDAASVLAAGLLDVRPGDSVLDLCAAPGGKSIALAQKLWPDLHADSPTTSTAKASRLVCNEADGKRHKRLADNLRAYLPPELFKQDNIVIAKVDATQPSPALGTGYDRVLVDAPCSSERHIVHASLDAKRAHKTAPEMATWRASSSKRLAATQLSLLMTALKAVKVGGQVIYATCSISPVENDGVLEKMLSSVQKELKKGQKWSVELGMSEGDGPNERQLEHWAERTKYGWIVLPDNPSGGRWGPLFFALARKVDAR